MNEYQDIRSTLETILSLLSPTQVYLFGVKKSECDDCVTDFDLGVVTPLIRTDGDRLALVKQINLELDTDTPFDLFLYSPSEWEALTQDESSFASRIKRKGRLLYENQ